MRIRGISNVDDFKSIRGTWNDLLAKDRNKDIFLTWEWLFEWWEHFGANKKLNILMIEDRDDTIGIMPLLCSTYRNFLFRCNVVENMGLNLSDYGGIIYSDLDDSQINRMFSLVKYYLNYNKLIFRLDQITGDSKLLNILNNPSFFQDSLFIGAKRTGFSPYLPIRPSLDDHLKVLSTKFRKNLRSGEKNIEKKIGHIEFKKFTTIDTLEKNLSDFWEMHQKKMNYQNVPGFSKTQKAFLTEVAKKFAQKGWLNLSFLDINGRHASGVLGFEYNSKYYYYQTAFDPDCSFSVGNIHILYILKDLINRGLKEFDFLRGDEAYKLRWQPMLRSNNRIIIMTKNPVSGLQFKILNYLFLYDEIKKHSLLENYRLYDYRMKQIKETGKIKFKNKV
ncbi:MAG: GNAT family N-acetyltransferase [Candidatus Methanoperedens sp.]|nr:GNAT family N-acetyltransferase [Candidatus Methanoperedens sp.]